MNLFDVWGAEDFGLLFMCPCAWFGVFGPSFPILPQYPSTCETGITKPTEGLDTSVTSHMMWNKESITFCVTLYMIQGYLGPFPPNYPQNRYKTMCSWSFIHSHFLYTQKLQCGMHWLFDYFLEFVKNLLCYFFQK